MTMWNYVTYCIQYNIYFLVCNANFIFNYAVFVNKKIFIIDSKINYNKTIVIQFCKTPTYNIVPVVVDYNMPAKGVGE